MYNEVYIKHNRPEVIRTSKVKFKNDIQIWKKIGHVFNIH